VNRDESTHYIKKRLEKLSYEMLDANKILSSGKLNVNKEIALSNEIKEMYFGHMNVAKRVEFYANASKELVLAQQVEEMKPLVNFFDMESEELLQDLNKIVAQYQKEGEADLLKIQHLESIIYAITLITLLLEVIFIF
jgi:hypothetical protein